MSYKNNVKVGYVRTDSRIYEMPREKCKKLFKYIFFKIKVELIDNGIIFLIPKYKKNNNKIMKKLIKQLNYYIKLYEIDYLVFEKDLKFLEKNFNSTNILNGKFLMKDLLVEILEYIFAIKKQNMNLENIYIFVNKYSKNNLYLIQKLISKFRTVNIITENLRYYKRLENSLYEDGILITVSNNKRKSAKNAKYIINIDFEKDVFEKYNINMNSTIINLTDESIFFKKSFNGVQVNNFEVVMDENNQIFVEEFYGDINKKIFIESLVCSGRQYYEKAEKLYKQYGCYICSLIGIRGALQKCEFLV